MQIFVGDRMTTLNQYFMRNPNNDKLNGFVSEDGLPIVGQQYQDGDIYASIFDCEQNQFITKVRLGFERDDQGFEPASQGEMYFFRDSKDWRRRT